MVCTTYSCYGTFDGISTMFMTLGISMTTVMFIIWALVGLRWFVKQGSLTNVGTYMLYGGLLFSVIGSFEMFVRNTALISNIAIVAIAIILALAGFRLVRTVS